MILDVSAGEVIRIGDAATLTVVAVESDLIRFVLETPDGAIPSAGDVGKDSKEADFKRTQKRWEPN
jgi:hypothetical protein